MTAPADTRPRPCRRCGALIRWIETARGAWLPLDTEALTTAEPSAVLFGLEGERRTPRYPGEAVTGYLSHFATCPDAARWRRPRRRPRAQP